MPQLKKQETSKRFWRFILLMMSSIHASDEANEMYNRQLSSQSKSLVSSLFHDLDRQVTHSAVKVIDLHYILPIRMPQLS